MKTTLLLARHGNTFSPGDVVTRVGARSDLPLVASGLEQGRKLGLYLAQQGLAPDVVFCSALQRTRQTAEQALAAAGLSTPIKVNDLFNEIDYGVDENRPEADVVARVGADALKAWDEDAVVPEGWKVDVQAIIRGWKAFGEQIVREYPGKKVMVVTSNGIARFSPHLTGDFAGFRKEHKLKISTGALCLLTHEGGWRVEAWNVKP
jgi:probable phosphoglycerate mutase